MNRLQKRGVPAGVVQTAKDRCTRDPQLQDRGYFVSLPHTEIGTWPIENFPAKFQNMPVSVGGLPGRGAPCMGEDNDRVYGEVLGLTPEEIAALREDWII
jgi:crotonobetainyl-CoA:carnitine CoA-transferase CaiB-like acyl-CoA transferase